MDDIELLELAAKAADIEVTSAIVDLWRSKEWSSVWNPLRSSGHALELAIRCELDLVLTMHGTKVAREDGIFADEYSNDAFAAARRAIVRAAAEIGKRVVTPNA